MEAAVVHMGWPGAVCEVTLPPTVMWSKQAGQVKLAQVQPQCQFWNVCPPLEPNW